MIGDFLAEMRLRQWHKNILVYAAIAFGGRMFERGAFHAATSVFFAFCLVASGVYFINDIFDAEKDRLHPVKKNRPIAAGRIPVFAASASAAALFAAGLFLAWRVNARCFWLLMSYIIVNLAYTVRLKHVVILDVMTVAFGFVVRAVIGAAATETEMTEWFILCVMFLSLFLALGKRRNELVRFAGNAGSEGRRVLRYYSRELIDQLISIVTASTLMCYSLFAVSEGIRNRENMFLTIPLVIYGIFYYIYLVRMKGVGEAPDEAVWREKPILLAVLLYMTAVIMIRNG